MSCSSMMVLSGTIVHGVGRGRALGFPTANVHPMH
ncbi:hypothetical protein HY629_03050, partial [Candidatus Uhrbacteria bacterium]|nr:hypothetical protein [Candidatus Uhrbacteria bacterium]